MVAGDRIAEIACSEVEDGRTGRKKRDFSRKKTSSEAGFER
jgi:hypothetical protein